MPRIVFDDSFYTVTARYLVQKPDGTFFYQRKVPLELKSHYDGKSLIRRSLKTKDAVKAAREAKKHAEKDNALWRRLKLPSAVDLKITTNEAQSAGEALLKELGLSRGGALEGQVDHYDPLDDKLSKKYGWDYQEARYGDHRNDKELEALLNPVEVEALRALYYDPNVVDTRLSGACSLYLKYHKNGRKTRFQADTLRAIQHVINAVGDLPLEKYTRKQARDVVDFILKEGVKTPTVRRRLRTISAVFNKGLLEFELKNVSNPFLKLDIVGEGDDATKRVPFNSEELITIAAACKTQNDDIRQIIAMHMDTGGRAGEIIGLRIEDICLETSIPYVWIRPHVKGYRSLKTAASKRQIPLVGMALWSAQQALNAVPEGTTGWLFPRYASDDGIKATHAENTINNWLKTITKTNKTSHCFRHAMRDRLRTVNAPSDIQNEIGGWGSKTIGEGYGEGYPLEIKQRYLQEAVEKLLGPKAG